MSHSFFTYTARASFAQVMAVLTLVLLFGCLMAADSPRQAASGPVGTPQLATVPPVITSATTASGTIGIAFTYQITATQEPTSFGASGLPSGLSVNSSTGLISGTPTVAGTSSASISAANELGTGTGGVTITIAGASGPPVISSPTSASVTVGVAFSYQIVASHNPTSYSATSLPTGLSLSVTTGEISGTPSLAGTTVVTIGASNVEGMDTETLTITVADSLPPGTQPQITSSLDASGRVATAFSYMIQATNTPTSYGASGLPSGLTVDPSTGLISGTPAISAVTNVSIFASNADGTDTETLRLVIATSSGSLPPGASNPNTKGGANCGSGSGLSVLLLSTLFAIQALVASAAAKARASRSS